MMNLKVLERLLHGDCQEKFLQEALSSKLCSLNIFNAIQLIASSEIIGYTCLNLSISSCLVNSEKSMANELCPFKSLKISFSVSMKNQIECVYFKRIT